MKTTETPPPVPAQPRAPVIQGQIFDTGQITGSFTRQSAEDMALSLKSGYLPATMKLIGEKTF